MTPKIRRWLGTACLVVGITLMLVDWSSSFRLTWPAVVGSRLLIPGALLLVPEALILLQARYGARFDAHRRAQGRSRENEKAKA